MPHPLRVAIDGRSAAGKTTLANELATILVNQGHDVIRVSVDDFRAPSHVRYARGLESPEGYYLDSCDLELLRTRLLEVLGPGGNRSYVKGSSDREADVALPLETHLAPEKSIVLIDGVFLFRPELNAYWDYRIFIDVAIDETLRRAQARDVAWMDSRKDVLTRYQRRYVPGEDMYIEAVNPLALADIVIENTNPAAPALKFHQRRRIQARPESPAGGMVENPVPVRT
jgi:uridine kinase